MGPEVPRAEQRALLDTAVDRVKRAQTYFESHDMFTDAMNALNVSCIRDTVLGDDDPAEEVYREIRARAIARGDKMFEVRATQNLASIEIRHGNVAQAVAMFESVLPLDRARAQSESVCDAHQQSGLRPDCARRIRPCAVAAYRSARIVFLARR